MSSIQFILFEMNAIENLIRTQEFQSYEYLPAQDLIRSICEGESFEFGDIRSIINSDGILFIGKQRNEDNQFLLFDLTQCDLILSEKGNPENILIVLLKSFRAAIRFWRNQPFTSAERVNHTKLIIFPYRYNMNGKQNKRLVLERQPGLKRLLDLGIKRPLLAYKYNGEDVSDGANEIAEVDILEKASICLLSVIKTTESMQSHSGGDVSIENSSGISMMNITSEAPLCKNEGFRYMQYDQKKSQLTEYQKQVIENPDIKTPIRVDGPAGTGKTMSLILRANRLLCNSEATGKPFRVVFFAHSESTKYEIEETFKVNSEAERYLEAHGGSKQSIEIITLLEWCRRFVGFKDSQLTDLDATTAKGFQRLMLHEAYLTCYMRDYSTYAPHLSDQLKEVLIPKGEASFTALDYMLQHEFSVQIKGRANGDLDNYIELPTILNGLPVLCEKDKEFVYGIYREYQNQLDEVNQYDTDDVVIEAISRLNAPFWRRERASKGYDYIFVDEMHLFNSNEQYAFHYLTQDINQKHIPICFALDYSQAIGDRGDVLNDYIETEIGYGAIKQTYQTVFRSSQEITDFCASIVASGTQIFESSFKNPYRLSVSGLTEKEEKFCKTPALYMYANDDEMIRSIKRHISNIKKEFGSDCKNYEIAVISFVDRLLEGDTAKNSIDRDFFVLKSRNAEGLNSDVKRNNQYILTSPYNVNGLEFKCVILVGVDEGRVPQTNGTGDISANYLRYTALNQLYLCCSRAKYRIVILGNSLHGQSSCLNYPIQVGTLVDETPTLMRG